MTERICACGCGRLLKRDAAGVYRSNYHRGHRKRQRTATYTINENGCWIWNAKARRGGYGLIGIDGKSYRAHRWMYEQLVGPIPEGLQIDHLCRVRECVNPAHLEPVTHAENGRRGKNTRLTAEDARAVRASDESDAEAAVRYGVSKRHINRIRNHLTWNNLESEAA